MPVKQDVPGRRMVNLSGGMDETLPGESGAATADGALARAGEAIPAFSFICCTSASVSWTLAPTDVSSGGRSIFAPWSIQYTLVSVDRCGANNVDIEIVIMDI